MSSSHTDQVVRKPEFLAIEVVDSRTGPLIQQLENLDSITSFDGVHHGPGLRSQDASEPASRSAVSGHRSRLDDFRQALVGQVLDFRHQHTDRLQPPVAERQLLARGIHTGDE